MAVITDEVRDGRPVIGYGFNSNGRYGARGLLQDRFIPRLASMTMDTLYTGAMFLTEKEGGSDVGQVKTLARGFATLGGMEHDEEALRAIANAAKLQAAIEPYFEGVRATRREEPEPAPEPKPKPRGGVRQVN